MFFFFGGVEFTISTQVSIINMLQLLNIKCHHDVNLRILMNAVPFHPDNFSHIHTRKLFLNLGVYIVFLDIISLYGLGTLRAGAQKPIIPAFI